MKQSKPAHTAHLDPLTESGANLDKRNTTEDMGL